MIQHKDYFSSVNELLTKLNEKKIIIPFNDDVDFDKIFERNNSTMHISEMKYIILTDSNLYEKYKKFWQGFNVNGFDLYNDFIQQGASYILGLFEMLRRFLLMILDMKKLKLNEESPLGTIIHNISKTTRIKKEELNKLFMLRVRNIIAHDSWYFEKKKFCYRDNEEIKKLDLEEFVQLIKDITDFTTAVAISWHKYVPNLEFQRMKEKMWGK